MTINYKNASPGKGHVNSITDAAGTVTQGYDSFGRLLTKTRAIDTRSYLTQYQYNTINQVQLIIYPSDKRVRVSRDTLGRTSAIEKVNSSGVVQASYMSGIGYSVASQPTGLTLGNGVIESYGYGLDRLQLTSQSASKNGNPLLSLTYSYAASAGASGTGTQAGNSGQLMSITGTINNQNRNQTFTYDSLSRLKKATGWGAWNRRYEYDRWTNRKEVWEDDVLQFPSVPAPCLKQRLTLVLDQNQVPVTNRIAGIEWVNGCDAVASYKPGYDLSGNLVGDGLHTYQYDAESRQVNVDSGATSISVYDDLNRRVKKTTGGATTHYVWEGSQVIAEYNATTGALICEYIHAGSRMVAREQGSAIRYFHQGRLNTRMVTDGSGAVVGTMDYYPYGEERSVSGELRKSTGSPLTRGTPRLRRTMQ